MTGQTDTTFPVCVNCEQQAIQTKTSSNFVASVMSDITKDSV